MIKRADSPNRWRRVVALLALLFAMGLTAQAQGALAGKLTDTAAGLPQAAAPPGSSSGVAGVPGSPGRPQGDSFMTIDPSVDTFGNFCLTGCPGAPNGCPAGLPPCNPANGDQVNTGDRFALDVNLHAVSDPNVTAAQAYVDYGTNPGDVGYAYVVEAAPLALSCVLTSGVKADTTTFDTVLQNEWCNGEGGPCVFRNINTPIGWGAIALGALNTCTAMAPCTGDFRIATIPLCAWQPGQFTIHWQFS